MGFNYEPTSILIRLEMPHHIPSFAMSTAELLASLRSTDDIVFIELLRQEIRNSLCCRFRCATEETMECSMRVHGTGNNGGVQLAEKNEMLGSIDSGVLY